MRMKQSLGASTIAVLTLIAPGYAQSTDPNEAPERQVTLAALLGIISLAAAAGLGLTRRS